MKFVSTERLSRFLTKIKDIFVAKSGGTMTGDLIVGGNAKVQANGYVIGTWLQGTTANHLSTKPPKIAVQDSSGWIYHRTPAEILSDIGAASTSSYTFAIGTSWTGTSAPYTQTITVSGILSTDDPIVDLVTSITNYEKEIEEYAKIFKITTAEGKLTVYATAKTTTALTCKLKVVR